MVLLRTGRLCEVLARRVRALLLLHCYEDAKEGLAEEHWETHVWDSAARAAEKPPLEKTEGNESGRLTCRRFQRAPPAARQDHSAPIAKHLRAVPSSLPSTLLLLSQIPFQLPLERAAAAAGKFDFEPESGR